MCGKQSDADGIPLLCTAHSEGGTDVFYLSAALWTSRGQLRRLPRASWANLTPRRKGCILSMALMAGHSSASA